MPDKIPTGLTGAPLMFESTRAILVNANRKYRKQKEADAKEVNAAETNASDDGSDASDYVAEDHIKWICGSDGEWIALYDDDARFPGALHE